MYSKHLFLYFSVDFFELIAEVCALIEEEIKNAKMNAIIIDVDFFIISLFCYYTNISNFNN